MTGQAQIASCQVQLSRPSHLPRKYSNTRGKKKKKSFSFRTVTTLTFILSTFTFSASGHTNEISTSDKVPMNTKVSKNRIWPHILVTNHLIT